MTKKGSRAPLEYLPRGPRVSSYATGQTPSVRRIACLLMQSATLYKLAENLNRCRNDRTLARLRTVQSTTAIDVVEQSLVDCTCEHRITPISSRRSQISRFAQLLARENSCKLRSRHDESTDCARNACTGVYNLGANSPPQTSGGKFSALRRGVGIIWELKLY